MVDSCAKAWQNAGKAVNLHKYWIMEAKKIVHLQFKEPYNGETELYKADTMDIPALLPQNRAMVGFLSEQFGI